MPKRAAIYVRVSTDKQTIENQLRELHRIAEHRGWEVVKEYRDAAEGATLRQPQLACTPIIDGALRRTELAGISGSRAAKRGPA